MAGNTTNTRATLQDQGTNNDTWGDVANDEVFDVLDQGFSYTEYAISDADQSLTMPDGSATASGYRARSLALNVTGTLTADREISLLPNTITKTWIVKNGTTGGFALTLTNGSGATVSVAAGDTVIVGGISGGGLATILDTSSFSGGGGGDVPSSRNINTAANSGLAGGGDLSADRSLSLDVNNLTSGTPAAGNFLAYGTGALNRRAAITDVMRYGMLGLPLEATSGDVTEVYVTANGQPKRIAIGNFPSSGGSSYGDSDVEAFLGLRPTSATQSDITHYFADVNGVTTRVPIASMPVVFGMSEITSLDAGHRFLVGKPDGSQTPRLITIATLATEVEPLITTSVDDPLTQGVINITDNIDINSSSATLLNVRDSLSEYLKVTSTGTTVAVLTVTGSASFSTVNSSGAASFGGAGTFGDNITFDAGGTTVETVSAASSGSVGSQAGFIEVEIDGTPRKIPLHNI